MTRVKDFPPRASGSRIVRVTRHFGYLIGMAAANDFSFLGRSRSSGGVAFGRGNNALREVLCIVTACKRPACSRIGLFGPYSLPREQSFQVMGSVIACTSGHEGYQLER